MKKVYLLPETEVVICKLENNILSAKTASSADLTITDDDGDWIY